MRKEHVIRIEVLRGFQVTRGGKPVKMEANTEAILHGLALSDEEGLSRDDLEAVLPEPRKERRDQQQAVRNALGKIWGKRELNLPVTKRTDRVVLPRGSEEFSVDLWDFFRFAEEKRYRKARELINPRGSLQLPRSELASADLWRNTLDEFDRARSEVLNAIEARLGRVSETSELRERLLDRSLIFWADPQLPIRDYREKVEAVKYPWQLLKPRPRESRRKVPRTTLHGFLANELDADDRVDPHRMLMVSEPGRGKTQAAIAIFLCLTDHLDGSTADLESRPMVFVDAHDDGTDPDFGTDVWLERRTRGADGLTRPVVIMAHAEAFFAGADADLEEVLRWRLFRECDVLLCCTERFYSQDLKYKIYPTHVARLELWTKQVQDEYAAALYGKRGRADLASWRDADPTGLRRDLCSIPLHLTFLLPLIRAGSVAREKISKRWHLLDQLSGERLRVSRRVGSVDTYRDELAAVAHRFYVIDRDPGEAVGFTARDLKDFLIERDPRDATSRTDAILNDTFVTFPRGVSDEDRFEHPAWGWFFTAYHIASTLKRSVPQEPPLRAFGKPFSSEVMDICTEMLLEWMPSHGDRILQSIHDALAGDAEPGVMPGQREVAHGQLEGLQEVLMRRV